MSTIQQIQELFTQQVAVWTDEFLNDARPTIEAEIRAEVVEIIDTLVSDRTDARLAAMRPLVEQHARTRILHALATNGNHVAEPVIALPQPRAPLTPTMVHDILTKALDPITASRGIAKKKGKWTCAFCDRPFDSQRAASMHARKCDKRAEVLARSKETVKPKTGPRKTKNSGRTCIKPGCDNPSKGPRNHHLCEEHKGAPKRHVRAWQRKLSQEPRP